MRTVLPSIYENMYLPKMLIGSTMSVTNKSDTAKFPTKINSRDFLLIVWQTDTRIRRFPKVPISAAIARIRTLVKAIPGASQTNWKRPNVFSSASNGDPLLLFILKILKFCWSIFSLRAHSTVGEQCLKLMNLIFRLLKRRPLFSFVIWNIRWDFRLYDRFFKIWF